MKINAFSFNLKGIKDELFIIFKFDRLMIDRSVYGFWI